MGKITKKQLQESHNKLLNQFASLVRELKVNNVIDDSVCPTFTKKTEPQLKQLDQSVFDGLDEKWRFAAVDEDGAVAVYLARPICNHLQWYVEDKSLGISYKYFSNKKGYDASNWQNSLIERDTAKELAGIDLSSELTGSELCKAMLARGDKYVSGFGHHQSDDGAVYSTFADTVTRYSHCFHSAQNSWDYFVPINNQGEPLTASEVGL